MYYGRKTALDGSRLYSYSQMSAMLSGKTLNLERYSVFGRHFHNVLLFPTQKDAEQVTKTEKELARAMVQKLYDRYGFLYFFGKGVRREWEYYRKIKNVWVKGKLDRVSANRKVITDFKTTDAYSQSGVIKAVSEYNYDLQAYTYLNLEKQADVFELVFIQKRLNPELWVYRIFRGSVDYLLGEEKFNKAIAK